MNSLGGSVKKMCGAEIRNTIPTLEPSEVFFSSRKKGCCGGEVRQSCGELKMVEANID